MMTGFWNLRVDSREDKPPLKHLSPLRKQQQQRAVRSREGDLGVLKSGAAERHWDGREEILQMPNDSEWIKHCRLALCQCNVLISLEMHSGEHPWENAHPLFKSLGPWQQPWVFFIFFLFHPLELLFVAWSHPLLACFLCHLFAPLGRERPSDMKGGKQDGN